MSNPTIPETVARVLDLDAKATPGPWNGATDETGDGFVDQVKTGEGVFIGMALHAAPSELGVGNGFGSPEWADNASLVAYYRTAAPALAREVERLLGLLDALPASWRNLSDERNTARAECERLRAVYAAALAMLAADEREDADPMGGHDVGHAVDAGKARRALLKATKAARIAEVSR